MSTIYIEEGSSCSGDVSPGYVGHSGERWLGVAQGKILGERMASHIDQKHEAGRVATLLSGLNVGG